ncbi:MAG: D-alanyl-D-alanine carboxypeptidase family protein [bacterium]
MRKRFFLLPIILAIFLIRPVTAQASPGKGEKGVMFGGVQIRGTYQAAMLAEGHSGRILFEKDADKPWPPASLTKMMLELLVMERVQDGSISLSDKIKVSARASKTGGSQVYLKHKEVFTLEKLMESIAIHSANDSCVAVAEYVGGSVQGFVDLMNIEAKSMGLKHTSFHSVHGLPPEPGQKGDVVTARDLMVVALRLIKIPRVTQWSSTVKAPFRGGKFIMHNTNRLIGSFRGADGLKTGHYSEAGYNLVATAQRKGLRLISIVLGCRSEQERKEESARMLSFGFNNFVKKEVFTKGKEVTSRMVKVDEGKKDKLIPIINNDLSAVINRRNKLTYEYHLPRSIKAPVKQGQKLGTVTAREGTRELGKADLISPVSIKKISFWRKYFPK